MAPHSPLLVLGAGYIGAKVAELALERGVDVTLADNWHATRREQLAGLEHEGAVVETVDIRFREALGRLLARPWSRVLLLAAQASRPLSFEELAKIAEAWRYRRIPTIIGAPAFPKMSSIGWISRRSKSSMPPPGRISMNRRWRMQPDEVSR